MNRTKSNFLPFVAYLQVIGIILVVFGHSFHEYPDGESGTSLSIYRMMYSFRMPLFMFTSGFLMAYTTSKSSRSWLEFCGNKVKRLLVPFMFLTTVTFVPRVLMSGMADDSFDLSLNSFLLSFIDCDYMPIPYFWFIHSSFTLLVFTYAVIFICRKHNIQPIYYYTAVLVLFIVLVTRNINMPSLLSVNMTVRLSIYFIGGCMYCQFMDKIDSVIAWTKITSLPAFALAWLLFFYLREHGNNTAYYYLCGFFGIMMIISLAKILEARKITVLDHLIGTNYMIFLLSWYFNVLAQQVLAHFVELPWWIHTCLSMICGIYAPWMLFKYIQTTSDITTTRIISALLGQSLKRKSSLKTISSGG